MPPFYELVSGLLVVLIGQWVQCRLEEDGGITNIVSLGRDLVCGGQDIDGDSHAKTRGRSSWMRLVGGLEAHWQLAVASPVMAMAKRRRTSQGMVLQHLRRWSGEWARRDANESPSPSSPCCR